MTMSNYMQLRKLGVELVDCMKEYIEELEIVLPRSVSVLDSYVNDRKLPKPLSSSDEVSEISWSIMFLGSALELKPQEGTLKYNDMFMPPWAYKTNNPLQDLLNKAESYFELDFESGRYVDAVTGQELKIFTLEDIAAVSGLQLGTVRNAANAKGDLKTKRFDNVNDKEGNRIKSRVFVEHEVALEWLQKKNAYEPLRTISENIKLLSNKIASFGPRFDGKSLPDFLKLSEKGDLVTYYAPFEHINKDAKVVLCGITPGAQQAEVALNTLASALNKGLPESEALKLAKDTASFAGPMRKSLVKMLDYVGLHKALGINSCDCLFSTHKNLVHYTSALRNPVFFRGQNYTGNPLMLKELTLKHQIDSYLKEELQQLNEETLYIPLGPKPAEALQYLANQGVLKDSQILSGIPHPSGANAERIKYFTGEKAREDLSSKTNADALDFARASVIEKINRYRS